MFYTEKEKQVIKNTFDYVEEELQKLRSRLAAIEGKQIVDTVAPWGVKKDGTPKKKPGRKAKQ